MNYLGEIAASGTALFWAISALLFTLAGRRIGAGVVNLTRLVIAFALISICHWIALGSIYPWETEPWRFGVLALSAILGLVVGDGALFMAFVLIGPRLAMLIMTLVPVFSAYFAWICFGESITPWEWCAMIVAVGAIGWVVTEKRTPDPAASSDDAADSERQGHYALGIGMAVIGALGQTANLVVTKYALVDGFSELSATGVRLFVSMVILLAWNIVRGNLQMAIRQLKDVTAVVQTSVGALIGPFLGIWLSYIAINHTRIGIAATIMAMPPLLLIPLAATFLKERITMRAVIGTAIAVCGVAVLFLS